MPECFASKPRIFRPKRLLRSERSDLVVDDFLAKEMNRRKKFLEKIIKEKSAALRNGRPGGRLRCVDRNGRAEYYWRQDTKSKSVI